MAGLFSSPYMFRCGMRICPQAASLPTTITMGSLKRTAVSKSKPFRPNDPSPWITITGRSGASSFAASAKGAPTPRQPSGPGSSHRPGRGSWMLLAATATTLPPSATKVTSPARWAARSISLPSRKWWMGRWSLCSNSACRSSLRASLFRSRVRQAAAPGTTPDPASSCSSTLRESPTMPTSMGRLRPISAASTSTWTTRAPGAKVGSLP